MSIRQLEHRSRADTTEVAWRPRTELGFDEWQEAGRRLGMVGRACQWWIGDWLNYGAATYGEKYEQAIEVTGLDIGTLMNLSWVAGAFAEISRRHENLSWSHHYEVAGLDPDERDTWLDRAEQEGWSRKRLRNALRMQREASPAAGPAPAALVFRLAHEGEGFAVDDAITTLCDRAEELGFTVLARPIRISRGPG